MLRQDAVHPLERHCVWHKHLCRKVHQGQVIFAQARGGQEARERLQAMRGKPQEQRRQADAGSAGHDADHGVQARDRPLFS